MNSKNMNREQIPQHPERGKAEKTIEHAEGLVRRLTEAPLEEKTKTLFAKKLYERTKRFAKRVAQIGALMTLGLAANHEYTHREQVVQEQSENGEAVFRHPDSETTHILNYLAGKEAITASEQLTFLKEGLKLGSKQEKFALPDNFDDMSTKELHDYAKQHLAQVLGGKDFEDSWNGSQVVLSETYEFDPVMYKAIWNVEQQAGAPRIRWLVKDQGYGLKRFSLMGGVHPSHYDPLTNTIYIFILSSPIDDFAKEMPHAQQFSQDPVGSYLKGTEELLRILRKGVLQLKSPIDAQDEEYSIPGSLEYEAHKIIEPQIREKLK